MHFHDLLVFALTALVVIAIPGPSVVFIVSRALAHGRSVALLTVIGNSLGEYLQVIAIAFGVGFLVQQSMVFLDVLRFGGAAYLVFLGLQTWRGRGALRDAIADMAPKPTGPMRSILEGWVVGVANPKTLVFLTAVLPQFVTRSAGNVSLQILLLGAVFTVIAVFSDSAWALLSGAFRTWFVRSPRRLELVGGTGGLAMAAVGVGLAVSSPRKT